MARIRAIKPGFFRHEGLQDLELANPGRFVMLVFAGLWGQCDKAGRFRWQPRTLKLDILPFLNFDMAETLDLLAEADHIRRYEVDGVQYGLIPTFAEHQRVSGKEAQEPEKHPPPPVKQEGSDGEATEKHLPGQERSTGTGKGVQEQDSASLRSAEPQGGSEPPDWRAKAWKLSKELKIEGSAAGDMLNHAGKDYQAIAELFERCKANKPFDPTSWCYAELKMPRERDPPAKPKPDDLTERIRKRLNGNANGKLGDGDGDRAEADAGALPQAVRHG